MRISNDWEQVTQKLAAKEQLGSLHLIVRHFLRTMKNTRMRALLGITTYRNTMKRNLNFQTVPVNHKYFQLNLFSFQLKMY